MDMNQRVEQYSADKLLQTFKGSNFMLALLLSLGIHVVFLGGTSVNYIMDRWVDPEGAVERKAKAEALLQAAASNALAKAAATNLPGGAATNAPVAVSPAPGVAAVTSAPAAVTNDLQLTNTAIMKQITETAKPAEIPPVPNDLGISIKDTNPQ